MGSFDRVAKEELGLGFLAVCFVCAMMKLMMMSSFSRGPIGKELVEYWSVVSQARVCHSLDYLLPAFILKAMMSSFIDNIKHSFNL